MAPGLHATSQAVRCSAEIDRSVLYADKEQRAVIKITLDAVEAPSDANRPPVNLCLVLDRSGSMSGSKIQKAREAALEAVNRLGKQDVFSLVTYSSQIETLIPASPLRDLNAIRRTIKGIQSSGNTALFGGVSQGASELRKAMEDGNPNFVHRMILLSDGLANVGPSSPEELGRLGASLVKEGISVSTIGVGDDYNEDLMTRLSGRSDGNSYFVEASQDLPRIFQEELGDVLSVVARKVIVTVECPEGVRPVRTLGREATIRGQEVEVRLNQLYGGQEKYVLLEVEVEPTANQQSRQLAKANLRYENALNQKQEKDSTEIAAVFSRDKIEVDKSINKAVFNDYYLNIGAEAKDDAVNLWEQGRKKEAAQLLRSNSAQLEQVAEDLDLPELEEEASNIVGQAQQLEKEGLTKRGRKILKTESYQERQQQSSKMRVQ